MEFGRIGRTLIGNTVSAFGAVLVTLSAALFLVLFLLDLFGFLTNPYLGLLVFVVVPLLFVAGLLLIPAGIYRTRRRVAAGREVAGAGWPRLDLNDPGQRRSVLVLSIATLANVVILSVAAYGGVHYMESPAFCGEVCHEVMQPEWASYQAFPHANVDCVACHVGSGATSFVRAKLRGTRQLLEVAAGTYPRPVPTPVESLRPARETCEQCHWPEKFHGDVIKTIREYAQDEQNTETVTTLRLHVGGGSAELDVASGIHWHMNVANEIEYIATDEDRQVIPWVRLRDRSGNVREFAVPGVTEAELAAGERRVMDCMDCHNRPAHTFTATPDRAVDEVMGLGIIRPGLPYIKRESVAALSETYASREEAVERIGARLRGFYRQEYPELAASRSAELAQAIEATQGLYLQNVFPAMNVTWGTYPNHIGHVVFPGCFRCHDGEHAAPDGDVIRQDCDLCHTIE